MVELRHYLAQNNQDIFNDWLCKVHGVTAKIAINRRVERLGSGTCGVPRFYHDGVWGLRIDIGAGFRVYYAISGQEIVLLLCGGEKRTRSVDINKACKYWQD